MNINNASKLKPYLDSESEIVKIWGIIRLGQIGHENDIERLVKIYENEPDQMGFMPPPRVKYYSLVAIGEIGGIKAEQTIMSIADKLKPGIDANSRNIGAGICDALGRIGSATAINILQSICAGEVKYGDAYYAQMNLFKIDLRKAEFKTFEDSLRYLNDLMESSNSDIGISSHENNFRRRAAELALLDILNENNIEIFEKFYQNKSITRISKQYYDKIVKLVRLKLKWHGGQYQLPDYLGGAVPTILSNKNIDSLSALLDNKNYTVPASLLHNVLLSEDADTSKFIELLLAALTRESQSPRIHDYKSGRVPMTFSNIRRYMMYMADNGKNYTSTLKSVAKKFSGDMSDWAIVALGLLRSPVFKDKLKPIILYGGNPYMRMWAVWALGEFNDPNDYEIFVKALSDPFYFHVISDVFLEDGTPRDYDNFIVRNQAFYALKDLGYSIIYDSTGNYHIEPEKK
jgi:HEAT repeat protein